MIRLLALGLVAITATAASLAIQHVTVIDATGKPAQPDMTVVIDGDKIASITPSAQAAKADRTLDATGKFLIPGLWDMHVHGAADPRASFSYPLYIANGVVGVREMFGPPDANGWRRQHASVKLAPSVYLASPIVDGPEPVWRGSIAVANAAQARTAVEQQKERGADFIKVYSLLPRDAYFAIADESHKLGITFAGHVPSSVTVEEASDAGQKSIEHLNGIAFGCSYEEATLTAELRENPSIRGRITTRAYRTYDEKKAQALFALFVKNGTWQCPTLTVRRSTSHLDQSNFRKDDRVKYIPEHIRVNWDPKNDFRFRNTTPQIWDIFREEYKRDMSVVGKMYRANVGIIAGTDTMNPFCFPGFSLHDELELLVESGLPPMAALQAATRNAAEFMGRLDRQGTVESGKVADLVLLDKNPLDDIRSTRTIDSVILRGQLLTRHDLDSLLSQAESTARR